MQVCTNEMLWARNDDVSSCSGVAQVIFDATSREGTEAARVAQVAMTY